MNKIEAFFNMIADDWDLICEHDPKKIQTILKRTGLEHHARILDIGCGTGILERFLLEYQPQQIVGIDIAGKMIDKAKEKYKDYSTISFEQKDAMIYTGQRFDYIIIYSAYPHFSQPRSLIKHMRDLLLPNGKLVICHSESKECINAHHDKYANQLSLPLPPAWQVAALKEPFLKPTVVEDNEDLYIICGQNSIT